MILHRDSDWTPVRVTVAGIGVAGFAAADALMQLGAIVTIVDSSDGEKQRERAEILGAL
jgi:UDP-N-acetylmuramoylalanine--D-glutamate ligase